MPNRTTESATRRPRGDGRRVHPSGLSDWLRVHFPVVSAEWVKSIQARRTVVDGDWDAVVDRFVDLFAEMIAPMIGPVRLEVEPLWTQTAELFGTAAAGRGLAAGEAIEELQILRELLLRGIYEDVGQGGPPPSLRELLLLNRAVDLAVTHASVGHTDALFFQLLESDNGREADPVRMAEAAVAQLDSVRRLLADVLDGARRADRAGVAH